MERQQQQQMEQEKAEAVQMAESAGKAAPAVTALNEVDMQAQAMQEQAAAAEGVIPIEEVA